MRNEKGFSLTELLISVAVLSVISAIVVPTFLQSRIAVNEVSAIKVVGDVLSSQMTYASTRGMGSYSPDLRALQEAGLIDGVLEPENSLGLYVLPVWQSLYLQHPGPTPRLWLFGYSQLLQRSDRRDPLYDRRHPGDLHQSTFGPGGRLGLKPTAFPLFSGTLLTLAPVSVKTVLEVKYLRYWAN